MIRVIGSFANGFILFSRSDEQDDSSIYIADQHAVHERVRLEMLMRHIDQKSKAIGTDSFPFSITPLDKSLLNCGAAELDLLKSRACQGIDPDAIGATDLTNCRSYQNY